MTHNPHSAMVAYMDRKLEKDEMQLNIRPWPLPLNKKLKVYAASQGRPLRSVVIEACKQWLTRATKKG